MFNWNFDWYEACKEIETTSLQEFFALIKVKRYDNL